MDLDVLWSAAIAPSTMAAYEAGVNKYCVFMAGCGLVWQGKLPPLTEQSILKFISYCHNTGLKSQTIKLYLAGIKYFYLRYNEDCSVFSADSSQTKIAFILKGVKRSQDNTVKRKLPITYDILESLYRLLTNGFFDPHTDVVMKCACTVAFFSFMRCGEFCVKDNMHYDKNSLLSYKNVQIHENKISIKLKQSKTDPFREGITIELFKTACYICPYECVVEYKNFLISKNLVNDTYTETPFFIEPSGLPLRRYTFLSNLRTLINALGIPHADQYGGHSIRRGATSTASACNLNGHIIKFLGRWRSSCFERYIDVDEKTVATAQQSMCKAYGKCPP